MPFVDDIEKILHGFKNEDGVPVQMFWEEKPASWEQILILYQNENTIKGQICSAPEAKHQA